MNTGFFAAYTYRRRKPPNIAHNLTLNHQQRQNSSFLKGTRSPVESVAGSESFLPSIPTSNQSNDGHLPYRRNDFANNHLFIAKHKLARIFLDQPKKSVQAKSDLIHLFDPQEQKNNNRKKNKNKTRKQEANSDCRSVSTIDQDAHLSVVNLMLKPSLPPSPTVETLPAITNRHPSSLGFHTKAPRPSIEWINPTITQQLQATSNLTARNEVEPNMIINELLDNQSDVVIKSPSPLDSSVMYVKSLLHSTGTQQ